MDSVRVRLFVIHPLFTVMCSLCKCCVPFFSFQFLCCNIYSIACVYNDDMLLSVHHSEHTQHLLFSLVAIVMPYYTERKERRSAEPKPHMCEIQLPVQSSHRIWWAWTRVCECECWECVNSVDKAHMLHPKLDFINNFSFYCGFEASHIDCIR